MVIAQQEIGVLNQREKVRDCFERVGWVFHKQDTIRGIKADMVAEKDGELAIVEIGRDGSDLGSRMKKALHFKNAANYAYLAMPKNAISENVKDMCRELGIGLVQIGSRATILARPKATRALESVRKRILQTDTKKKAAARKVRTSLFRSDTFTRILCLLMLNKTRDYHLNGLARIIGVAPSTVLREMNRIAPMGIVTRTKRGSEVFYQINRECVVYEELRRIVLKLELVGDVISEEMERHDVKYVLIYGSFASGTETEYSDVDLLVVGDVPKHEMLQSFSKAEKAVGRELNYMLWTRKELGVQISRKAPLLGSIRKKDIIMLRGDEDEFRRAIK